MPTLRFFAGVSRARRTLAAVVVALGWTMYSLNAAAQDSGADENRVKAGFVLNFAKYATWPQTPLPAEIKLCSLSNAPLDGGLNALQGRPIQGSVLQVRSSIRPSDLRDCQIVFISAQEAGRIDFILAQIANLPILTVSDVPGFVQIGGMIGLKLANDRIRFDVNLGAARRANIALSGNMIKLADAVVQ
jgi:hypothetical protein